VIRPALVILGALLALAAAGPAAAQALDPSSQDALNKTLQILLESSARAGELAKNSQGTAVDKQVRALAGSDALTQEFYALAGQVLAELVQSTQAADKGPSASLARSLSA
jgi:hypothetical protein